jgi:hypothetical protein
MPARGPFFDSVSRFDISASGMYGSPASNAAFLTASASLNTTRAHPNALASAVRCAGEGSRR